MQRFQQMAWKGIEKLVGCLRAVISAASNRASSRAQSVDAVQPEREIDAVAEAGIESFPASDPPSFTPEKTGR